MLILENSYTFFSYLTGKLYISSRKLQILQLSSTNERNTIRIQGSSKYLQARHKFLPCMHSNLCQQPLDEFTVQVWLLYHHQSLKNIPLNIDGTELSKERKIDDLLDRCYGIKNVYFLCGSCRKLELYWKSQEGHHRALCKFAGAMLKFFKRRSKVTFKVTCQNLRNCWKGLVIRNTYVKYECPIS